MTTQMPTREEILPYINKMRQIVKNSDCYFPPEDPTKILDYLYLGNEMNAMNRPLTKQQGITHIVNCSEAHCRDVYSVADDIKYIGFSAMDDNDYNILQHFEKVSKFIEEARDSEGKVLVHCIMGSNRSGALVVAYIMNYWKVGPISAAKFVKDKREVLLSNENFQDQLVKFAWQNNLLELDQGELDK